MVRKIILVFKTHFDIGFTDLAENVIHSYGSAMLREVIETCSATENLGKLRYVWTMPAWPLWYICSHCDPELKPELDRLIGSGQIVWHGLPFTSHTDFSVPEEYAEGFRYAKELADRYGKPMPIAAKMTDVPGHGLMLPDILSQAGIRFLHLGCNEFATPPDVPPLFFWQGPGGGKVLTMYSKGGYGTGLLPPKDWPYPVWMAMMHTHDNCGPQSAGLILEMAGKAQAAYPDADIVCGTMDDFCREMEKCDLSQVPVIRKDLADTWIHGVGSYPAEVSLMRECRERARKLHSRYFERLLSGAGEIPELEELWGRYYDAAALFTEHTWGADVKTWLGPDRVYEKDEFLSAKKTEPYQFMERSWQEQRNRVQAAAEALNRIDGLLGSEPDTHPQAQEDSLRTEVRGGTLTVENRRYRLTLNTASGKILRVCDRSLDAVILEGKDEGVFSYRYDRYGLPDVTEFLRSYGYHFTTWGIQDYGRENYPDCGHETCFPAFAQWEVQGNLLHLLYLTQGSGDAYGDARSIRLSIEFREDALLITITLEDKQETPFIESGSLIFPFRGKVSYRIGKPGGVIDPEKDIQNLGNHALFNLERQVTVQTERGNISICSLDAPLFGIGSPGVYEYRKAFGEDRPPALYFDLFNNMWGTNFPQWIGGSFRFRFLLRSGVSEPQVWAAEQCRGVTPAVPQGMELVSTRLKDGTLFITLRDLTGKAETRRLSVENMLICQTDILRTPAESWHESVTFPVRPWGLHVFALKKNAGYAVYPATGQPAGSPQNRKETTHGLSTG